jgi:hypothetical protein
MFAQTLSASAESASSVPRNNRSSQRVVYLHRPQIGITEQLLQLVHKGASSISSRVIVSSAWWPAAAFAASSCIRCSDICLSRPAYSCSSSCNRRLSSSSSIFVPGAANTSPPDRRPENLCSSGASFVFRIWLTYCCNSLISTTSSPLPIS